MMELIKVIETMPHNEKIITLCGTFEDINKLLMQLKSDGDLKNTHI